MRAPEAPIGWPSAQAPPCTFTLSCGKRVLLHGRHRHDRERFVDLEEVDVLRGPAGLAVELLDGADRRGREPRGLLRVRRVRDDHRKRLQAHPLLACERRISTSAAAPSEIELEFAAVTVPSLRNAGLSVGIFSGIAFAGCSSLSITTSPFRPGTVTGAISHANVPSLFAASARDSDAVANSSCCLARELVLRRAVLGERAHEAALVVRVLEPVEEHVVDAPAGGPCGSPSAPSAAGTARCDMLSMPPATIDVGRAGEQRIVREHRRFHRRAAHLVDGRASDRIRQPALERRLPRGRLALSRGQHAAHDRLVDVVGLRCPRARRRP